MEWYIKLPLAILGLVELLIRAVITIILAVPLFISEREDIIQELLTPWCFTYIQEVARMQSKSNTPSLSLRQQRKLEYLRQEQMILNERQKTLIDIQQLESRIGITFQPLPK